MDRVLLVTGGETPPRAALAPLFRSFRAVCAADSGLEVVHDWGLSPTLIVGDMDSLTRPELLTRYPAARIVRFDRAKDETDTELGIRLLSEAGEVEIIMVGGGGGRLDHLLAVRALFERALRPREWWTARERVVLVDRTFETNLPPGTTVSVFPLAEGAKGMRSTGLRWPLDGLCWGPGDFGISNEAPTGRIRVEPGTGALLIVLPVPS